VNAKINILLVDDNINMCRTLALILRQKGFRVMTAESGPETIGIIKKNRLDLILMDVKMTPLNGIETLRKIQTLIDGCVVFMMTAYAVEDLLQEALDLGAKGILNKPLDIDQVIDIATGVETFHNPS
jgi:two-component system response regulator HydG